MVGNSRNNAVNLFTFLKEYTRLSYKPVRSLDSDRYREVFWFGDVPREPECSCVLWKGEVGEDGKSLDIPSDGWLEIRRPDRSEPPDTPEQVAPWVNTELWADSNQEIPELYTTILNPDWESGMKEDDEEEIHQYLQLPDFPEIQEAWDKYVEDKWWAWAEDDRKKEKVQDCYNNLFRLHRAKLQMGDQYELVLSVGCLNWIDSNSKNEQIKRHVLTLASTVTFDSINAVVTVRPDGSMSDINLETDMLLLHQQTDEMTDQLLKDRKLELGTDILSDKAKELLKAMAHGLPTGDGKFLDVLDKVSSPATNEPTIYFSPALILRKRSSRTLIDVCERIENDLSDETYVIPPTVRIVVGERGVENGADELQGEFEKEEWSFEEAGEIFFPLPSNEEQKQIIGRMEKQTCVLVQGPPGTGKSQTIANLICHFLANGKRILITSQKTPALRVLKDKLPPSVADLCVLLLGEGQDQQTTLQKAVSAITNQYTSFDEANAKRKIRELQKHLEKLRSQESKVFDTLCALRSKEEDDFPARIGHYKGKLRDIAKQLNSEKDSFAWFRDDLPNGVSLLADQVPACPVVSTEVLATLSFLRSVSTADEARSRFQIPSDDDLPSPENVDEMVESESKAQKALESRTAHLEHAARKVLTVQTVEDLRSIAEQLHEVSSLKSATLGRSSGWEVEAGQQILTGESVVWVELHQTTEILLSKVRELLPKVAKLDVTGMEGRSPRAVLKDAKDLRRHLSDGGKLGVGPFRLPVVKQAGYLLKQVCVDGRPCKTCDSLEDLIQWLEMREAIQGLEEQWQVHAKIDVAKMPLNQVVSRFEQEFNRLVTVMCLGEKADVISETLTLWDPVIVPEWDQPESVTALERLANAIVTEKHLSQIRDWFSAEIKKVSVTARSSSAAPGVKNILTSLESRSVDEYREAHKEIQRLKKFKATIKERDQKVSNLKAKLPRLALDLLNSFERESWDALLKNIEAAWNWKCAEAWLLEVSDPGVERRLQANLKSIREGISETLANLAAELAWKHCINKMDDTNYSSLIAWKNVIGRLGKGKGKYAERNRAIARERLEECRGAVPAWVMPIHRVLDTVKAAPEIFDVVIIDEASQSGPEALFLSYLAKQMVVVGDDKQIRPDEVGLDQDQVHQLQRRYLKDIPHPEIYDPTESLFGVATVRFGNPVRLREHFRCMPEIIGFSNRLSYGDQPLIPLRQFGGDRIEPVLKTTYVEGGYQDPGKGKLNKVEAEKVVDAIEQCCEDPKYKDKTIGVISLLNTSDQDRYIEQLLVDRLDPEEIEQRNIVCGNAHHFQGDERDIIFLSTVSARSEGRRVRALTDQKAERRFNVAASRAKDQMWLFHSINAGDMGQNCLRRRLLTYMEEPKKDPLGGTISISLPDLHQLAREAQRSVDSPPYPFDSWFEVDVYLAIADRQYLVVPQYEVRGYRIDMVVVGGARKLAIECDGDYWHGPDEYKKDLQRQYDLERCEWEFFRIRGSAFYHDPEGALKELWKVLAHIDFGGPEMEEEEAKESLVLEAEKFVAKEAATDYSLSKDSREVSSKSPHAQFTLDTHTTAKPKRAPKKKTISGMKDVRSVEDLLSLTSNILGETIIYVLGERPNNSCKKEMMTTFVCQFYGVITRGNPRIKVQRRVNRAISHLKKEKLVREYKAKNVRIQLLPKGKELAGKNTQMDMSFDVDEPGESKPGRFGAPSSGNDGLLLKAVELLQGDQRPWSRSEIIKALQISSLQWKELVQELVSHADIVRTGEKLTTRYEFRNIN